MTLQQAIDRIDATMHNTYSREQKVEWISRLDSMVQRLIIDTHDGGGSVAFAGYDDRTGMDTELLAPAPFDEMYIRWLEAQIYYANGEYDKFNNAILMYQAAYDGYHNDYNRNHMPKARNFKFF